MKGVGGKNGRAIRPAKQKKLHGYRLLFAAIRKKENRRSRFFLREIGEEKEKSGVRAVNYSRARGARREKERKGTIPAGEKTQRA